ncbi:MAG: bifunctional adenosylcobinamide kinase/adenosylcobinamide-phosphate guanylyltransferase [Thiolinea sp.]
MHTLVLGGARSGKSHYAEQLAQRSRNEVVYIATAAAGDGEMSERIRQHRLSRPAHWLTIEEPVVLNTVLQEQSAADKVVLVDCLTLWVTNLLCSEDTDLFEREITALLNQVNELPGEVIFVSNEVGLGVVPMGELSRRFVDEAGRLHQRLAAKVENVIFMVAGLPMAMKGELQ